jgi:hypothetical protein
MTTSRKEIMKLIKRKNLDSDIRAFTGCDLSELIDETARDSDGNSHNQAEARIACSKAPCGSLNHAGTPTLNWRIECLELSQEQTSPNAARVSQNDPKRTM